MRLTDLDHLDPSTGDRVNPGEGASELRTQIIPASTATSQGPGPTGIVARTVFLAGSTRVSSQQRQLTGQGLPGRLPTGEPRAHHLPTTLTQTRPTGAGVEGVPP